MSEQRDFWRDKTPCWEMKQCSMTICRRCPAFKDRSLPCWQHENTLCDEMLGIPHTCDLCVVYKTYVVSPPAAPRGRSRLASESS